jgi:ABC-2 type transport system ATP-binding protein
VAVLSTDSRPADVELRGLVKSFGSGDSIVRAVQDVDVSIAPGETVALLGPNGAGKSTTIDMLLGLTAPDAGSVSLFGQTATNAVASGEVGAMLQTGGLIPDLSVRELIVMVASLYPRPLLDIDRVLEQTGVDGIAERRTQKLSGGETQRLRFALALVSDPALLVLDEPTVGMDVEARHAFWLVMRRVAAEGKTIVFATHYLEEADANADRVLLMAHGRIFADGSPVEIKAMTGVRTIRATVRNATDEMLAGLAGVNGVERHGDRVVLACSDSDIAIRALLERFADVREIEIGGADLEQAFLQLIGDGEAVAA